MVEYSNGNQSRPPLKIRQVSLDTGRENVVVISRHSSALRPEIFVDRHLLANVAHGRHAPGFCFEDREQSALDRKSGQPDRVVTGRTPT